MTPERLAEIRKAVEGTRSARQRLNGLVPEPWNTALLTVSDQHARDVTDLVVALAAAQARVSALEAAGRQAIEAFDLIAWMAKSYVEGVCGPGPEMRDYEQAVSQFDGLRALLAADAVRAGEGER